jgi:glutamine amidotransferase
MSEVVVFDYGFGNVRSVCRALEKVGAKASLTSDYDVALNSSTLVVPGVGAFGACMQGLRAKRGDEIVKLRSQDSRPVMGICVGHQILFDSSSESDGVTGLGIINAEVKKLQAKVVPHMGWNTVDDAASFPEFEGLVGERFYFVHSYAALVAPPQVKAAYTTHEDVRFVSAVKSGVIFGTQFHPEKSGEAGLALLERFVRASI